MPMFICLGAHECTFVIGCTGTSVCAGLRDEVNFCLSTYRLQRSNSGCQAWGQAPLLIKPPHQPTFSHVCIPLPWLLLDHYSRITVQVCIPYFHSSLIDLFVPANYTAGFQTFPMPSAAILTGTAFPFPVPCKACSSSIHCLPPLLYNLLLFSLCQQGCVSIMACFLQTFIKKLLLCAVHQLT